MTSGLFCWCLSSWDAAIASPVSRWKHLWQYVTRVFHWRTDWRQITLKWQGQGCKWAVIWLCQLDLSLQTFEDAVSWCFLLNLLVFGLLGWKHACQAFYRGESALAGVFSSSKPTFTLQLVCNGSSCNRTPLSNHFIGTQCLGCLEKSAACILRLCVYAQAFGFVLLPAVQAFWCAALNFIGLLLIVRLSRARLYIYIWACYIATRPCTLCRPSNPAVLVNYSLGFGLKIIIKFAPKCILV